MKKRTVRRRVTFFLIVIFLFLFGSFFLFAGKYTSLLIHLILPQRESLVRTNGNISVLLLGIGGGNHDGPNLSDTMIFASLDPARNKVTLISIPRDLWMPEIKGKINTSYANGEAEKKGGGLVLAKAVVAKIIGQDVPYAVRVDFSGFEKAVDLVGGLTINVDKTFDDYEYPIDGQENNLCGKTQLEISQEATVSANVTDSELYPCRYKRIHFNVGKQTMDGQTALEYVRSRHAVGSEGSDFARSKRQQKVISAFKDKLLSVSTLLNPVKILNLYGVLKGSIDTNITQSEMVDFIRLASGMKKTNMINAALDTGDTATERVGLLVHPLPKQNANSDFGLEWVLIPRVGEGNYTEIGQYVSCILEKANCVVGKLPKI